jgi:hypothetical protein
VRRVYRIIYIVPSALFADHLRSHRDLSRLIRPLQLDAVVVGGG